MTVGLRHAIASAAAVFGLVSLTGSVAAADLSYPAIQNYPDAGRFTIIGENDALFVAKPSDKHYTQGALLTYLSPSVTNATFASSVFTGVGSVLPIFQDGGGVKRKFDVVFGQSLFTPDNYRVAPLDPRDRPFAGWLYTGGSLLQETDGHMLENFELLVGTIGPDALGYETQSAFHDLIGLSSKDLRQNWKTQLRNEPGFALTYERKWRVAQSTLFGYETDIIPELGITAGNIFTYGEAGVTFRIGQDLGVDYGAPRIRPSLSGTAWFDPERITVPWGWYVFGGLQGRAVARNIFLDGNTFEDSRSVKKEIFVGDASVGAAVFYKDIVKIDASLMVRSDEFKTQADHGFPDRVGAVSVSVRF